MISIKELAILLLIGHFGSMFFIIRVLKRQFGLFKTETTLALNHFRKVLFTISLVIMLGNLVPITIDSLTLFVNLGRPEHLKFVSIVYSMSNALIEFASAVLVWQLYKVAANPHDITEFENARLNK